MAAATKARASQLLVQIGNGADPEIFAHPCLINSARGFTLTAGTSQVSIPDCDDPDLLQWLGTEKTSLSGSISGAGTLHVPNTKEFHQKLVSPDSFTCRVRLNLPGAQGGGYWEGKFQLTSFAVTGDRTSDNTVTCDITLESDGEVNWVDAT